MPFTLLVESLSFDLKKVDAVQKQMQLLYKQVYLLCR